MIFLRGLRLTFAPFWQRNLDWPPLFGLSQEGCIFPWCRETGRGRKCWNEAKGCVLSLQSVEHPPSIPARRSTFWSLCAPLFSLRVSVRPIRAWLMVFLREKKILRNRSPPMCETGGEPGAKRVRNGCETDAKRVGVCETGAKRVGGCETGAKRVRNGVRNGCETGAKRVRNGCETGPKRVRNGSEVGGQPGKTCFGSVPGHVCGSVSHLCAAPVSPFVCLSHVLLFLGEANNCKVGHRLLPGVFF